MKTLFAAVSAIGLLAASPAYAADSTIGLSGNVAGACGTGFHHSGGDATSAGWTPGNITNVDLTNGGEGQFNGQEFTERTFGNIWCNQQANVKIEVQALVNTTGENPVDDDSSFTNRFDIQVITDAGVYMGKGEDLEINTTGTSDGYKLENGQSVGAFETGRGRFGGADVIRVLKDPANRRPIAGDYNGYVKITASIS